MQKDTLHRMLREQRKILETRIIVYAKAQDKLDVYYAGLQEIFNTNIIGPVFKLFITGKIESIIKNDEFGIFYEDGTAEKMLDEIMTRLNQDVTPKDIEDVVAKVGEASVARIGENEDYQAVKETLTSKVKSVESEDYSIEEALIDIRDNSSVIEEFHAPSNPIAQEQERIDLKIARNRK